MASNNAAAAAPQMPPAKIPMKLPVAMASKTLGSVLPVLSSTRFADAKAGQSNVPSLPSVCPRDMGQDERIATTVTAAVSHAQQPQQSCTTASQRAVSVSSRASSTTSSASSYSSSSSSSSSSLSDNDSGSRSSSSSSSSSRSSSSRSSSSKSSSSGGAVQRRGGHRRSAPRGVRSTRARVARKRHTRSTMQSLSDEDDHVTLMRMAQDDAVHDHTAPNAAKPEQGEQEAAASQPNLPPPRPHIVRSFPVDIDKAIERCKERLNREENAVRIKDDNKAVSLGTSKINYIDPRIICSWASAHGVPIKKIFSATLMNKFPWALNAKDFNF